MKRAWAWFNNLHWIPKLIIIFVLLGGISSAMGSNDTEKKEQASLSTTTSTTIKATTTTEAPKYAIKATEAKVVRCVDGDTIEVEMDGKTEKVRLIGIDTPETVHPSKPVEAYGKEASDYTKSKLEGKTVFLEMDVQERDKYGRVLAYVWLYQPYKIDEGEIRAKMFNAQLLLDGYAQISTYPPNVKYVDYFTECQKEARDGDKGLWGVPETTTTTEAPSTTTTKPPVTTTTMKATTTTQKSVAPPTGGGGGGTTVYITNTGEKYHVGTCRYLSKSKIAISLSDAKAQGYEPCKVCRPPR